MTADEIQAALENAEGLPEEALRAAVQEAPALAPAVIAVAQRMAGGVMPLPREERLLRFGLHALAAARESSACPAFLALLRVGELECEWLFGEDQVPPIAQLLLGLFDGDDAAVCALAADPAVGEEVRSALMSALARLVWEGRASRERLLELLDRLDAEPAADPSSLAWIGWQEAILLLGLTDWIERVQRGWNAGRLPWLQHDADRQEWIEQTRDAAARPDDPERFVARSIVPLDDPVSSMGWSADPASGPGDSPTGDELSWLELLLWRRAAKGTMSLEEADGFLTALAAGPVQSSPAEFLPAIAAGSTDLPLFDSPEHDTLAGDLLVRHHAAIRTALAEGKPIAPWIGEAGDNLTGALWARGFMRGVAAHQAAWEKLASGQPKGRRLLAPIEALTPEGAGAAPVDVTPEIRGQIIRALPGVVGAIKMFWQHGEAAPVGGPLSVQPLPPQQPVVRARKIGRNELCLCGSGKKYKRCCGAAA
jgi:yecA family protein